MEQAKKATVALVRLIVDYTSSYTLYSSRAVGSYSIHHAPTLLQLYYRNLHNTTVHSKLYLY